MTAKHSLPTTNVVAVTCSDVPLLGASAYDWILERIEQLKASVRARVEHPFRMLKRQFSYVKARYRGLARNTAQLRMLFALANIWIARRKLLPTG